MSAEQGTLDFFGPRDTEPDADTPGNVQAIHTDTSAAAARCVWPKTGTQRMAVLRAIAAAPKGLTDPEIAARTNLYQYSAAPRRRELVVGGWVEDSGERRETTHGGTAIVWRLTELAQAELARRRAPRTGKLRVLCPRARVPVQLRPTG